MVIALRARSQGNLWDRNSILSLGSLDVRATNVSAASTTSREGSVTMVACNSFTHNLAVDIGSAVCANVARCESCIVSS